MIRPPFTPPPPIKQNIELPQWSRPGVPIDIVCRGICALRPGIPGVSETIRVISVVDRFLEHPRIFYFDNDGNPDVYVGSADWMDRNLSRRVEVVFPIEQPELKARTIDKILAISVADTVKARQLLPDGTYRRVVPEPGRPPVRSQTRYLELAAEAERRQTALTPNATPIALKPAKKPRGKKPG